MVKVGDKIPDVDLDESSPGDKVNLSKELTGKGVIIGVPAAFSKIFLRSLFSFPLSNYISQALPAPLPTSLATLAVISSRMPVRCL